jgi:hypothetical protein
MKSLIILVILILNVGCTNHKESKLLQKDTFLVIPKKENKMPLKVNTDTGWVKKGSVFQRRNQYGKLVEEYGDRKKKDEYGNFRFFYYYNDNGYLIREKLYLWLKPENINCIIDNIYAYREVLHFYNDAGREIREESYEPYYDSTGKYSGHKIHVITDYVNRKTKAFHSDGTMYSESDF